MQPLSWLIVFQLRTRKSCGFMNSAKTGAFKLDLLTQEEVLGFGIEKLNIRLRKFSFMWCLLGTSLISITIIIIVIICSTNIIRHKFKALDQV